MATPEQMRELLLTPEQAAALDAHGSKDAAVLVPLYLQGGELVVVLTVRRSDLAQHAGEISFPGGRQDHPEEDLRETALREAEEEVGLPRERVELVGALPPTGTFVTGYRIFPFVGLIEAGQQWVPQETEVDQVLELPLRALMGGHRMQRLPRKGVPFKTPTYSVDGHFVWGATARIMEALLGRLAPLLPAA